MEVLINRRVGGMFSLSYKVLKLLSENDNQHVRYMHMYHDYALKDINSPEVRSDPAIIKSVKKIGLSKSSGEFCELEIVDATPPFAIHSPCGEEVIIEYRPLVEELTEVTKIDQKLIVEILKRHLNPHYFYDSYIEETYYEKG